MTRNGYRTDRRVRNVRQLVHPPRSGDRITFPADFGTRYSVFVYVQESFDRATTGIGGGEAVRYIPEFQRLLEAHGIIPTYLLNYPVAMAGQTHDQIGTIAEAGRCVIGAQLNPWVTPPHGEERTAALSYAGNLDPMLEREKIETLSAVIAARFGQRPVVYRAGRYGVGPNTAQILQQLGYRMDVSIRPGYDYRADGGPDFSRHDARAFWAGPEAMLVALPVGAGFIGSLRRFGRSIHPHVVNRKLGGALARSGLLAHVALTPEDMPIADVKEAVRVMIDQGINVLSFSLHATSLVAGQSPYVQNSADLNALYRWCEEIFLFLAKQNVKPIASDAVIAAAWATRDVG